MEKVDFHIHTNASDGAFTPQDVIKEAKTQGVKYLAVTDHDSVSNVKICEYLAQEAGLTFIRATEICSKSFNREVHILGYDIDIDDIDLNLILFKTLKIRQMRDIKIMKTLINKGVNVSLKELKEFSRIEMPGLPIINYLIKKGVCNNVRDFNSVRDGANLEGEEDLLSSEVVIKAIKDAGGVAILAHPSYYCKDDVMSEEELDYYKNIGIDGIECYSSYNPLPSQHKYYTTYCKKNGLLISGGSDCHGSVYTDRTMGSPSVDIKQVDFFKKTRNYKHI